LKWTKPIPLVTFYSFYIEAMAKLNNEISRILGGVALESILQDATEGDFSHIMKLKDHFLKSSSEIDNLLATKCAISKKNLIHWLAYHKELEILK